MDDIRTQLRPPSEPVRDAGTTTLFLGLFLLVLAFFALLVSISTVQEARSSAVIDSVTSAFASVLPPSTDPTRFTSKDGDVLAAQQFQDEITKLYATSLQVAQVEILQPGRSMRVRLPTNLLFEGEDVRLRKSAISLLDRMVTSLSGRPPGLRFDMEFVIGSRSADSSNLSSNQTLEMARAGAFARRMISRGVPPDSIAIGIAPNDPDQVEIWYYVRRVDELQLQFVQ